MSKHTAGPWVQDCRGFPHADVRAESGRAIAHTWNVCHGTPKNKEHYKRRIETDRANARLISAAPELLVCCEEFMAVLIEANQVCDCGDPECRTTKLRAAIAKAKGGTA